ncbi:MAG: MmcB family DNA repair protein [Pseudomonadota bacterium]
MLENVDVALPPDGRQSDRALRVFRGLGRMMRAHGFACVPEVTLPNQRRSDLFALGRGGELWIVEIKSSIADFRSDDKWTDYLSFCDRFFFATLVDVPTDIFPDAVGLIVTDGFDAEIVRDCPETKLSAARRKALTLRIARQAADRLHTALDPVSAACAM